MNALRWEGISTVKWESNRETTGSPAPRSTADIHDNVAVICNWRDGWGTGWRRRRRTPAKFVSKSAPLPGPGFQAVAHMLRDESREPRSARQL